MILQSKLFFKAWFFLDHLIKNSFQQNKCFAKQGAQKSLKYVELLLCVFLDLLKTISTKHNNNTWILLRLKSYLN